MNTEYCVIGWRQDENDDCPLDEDCFYYSFINEVCMWPKSKINAGEVDNESTCATVRSYRNT